MPIQTQDFDILRQSLPAAFRQSFTNNDDVLVCAYPLLSIICKDQDVVTKLRDSFEIDKPIKLSQENEILEVNKICDQLLNLEVSCQKNSIFKYRLPIIIGEFPIHSRAINHAVKQFNQMIELDPEQLENSYKAILLAIKKHGKQCDSHSLWQLLRMIMGWSTLPLQNIFFHYPHLIYNQSECHEIPEIVIEEKPERETTIPLQAITVDSAIPNKISSLKPFTPNYNYNFNRAGRLATETDTLLLNAFGMKIGGHFDAQVKYPPKFIPISQLHAIIHRQLSHRLEIPQDIYFKMWIENTLSDLGVEYKSQQDEDLRFEKFVNPFLPQSMNLNPVKIQEILKQNHSRLISDPEEITTLNRFTELEFNIISQYLFELLESFKTNPGQALGIGANWDGTVNHSNEAVAYSFKFTESETAWGTRFKHLSLHRQGPAEVHMNAAKGIKYELMSLLTDFNYMSQVQPSEHKELLYNALIDNVVSILFPEPPYFENDYYRKYTKQHVVEKNENGNINIVSFYQPSKNGTYFKGKNGKHKQTPMYRRAGTLEVQAFPRNTGYSENTRACYAGNPLGPLQLQYTQSMHGCTRGHLAYDPVEQDQFIPDAFYGQVIRTDYDDYIPFIGVIPKNFDMHFKQPKELCASFVIRMLQSSRIMEYCPTFRDSAEAIMTCFLPSFGLAVPALPKHFYNKHIFEKHKQLNQALQQENRRFFGCQKLCYALFKNLVYSLYDDGKYDEDFRNFFIQFVSTGELFTLDSRASGEKIIRHLTVNKPVLVSPIALKKYDITVDYLRTLINYFYPKPTDAVAENIAKLAKIQVGPLLKSNAIHSYFEEMRRSQQANLSRQQTPGMAYSALKHGGPSKTIAADYNAMHEDNFPAGYRDPEGYQISEPQRYERIMDWFAKKLGATLQIMQRYNLFAVIRQPFAQTYIQGKEMARQHASFKPAWAFVGGIKGFANGIAVGILQTITTPIKMIRDLATWALPSRKNNSNANNNPLMISAAPANTPGVKVKTAMETRDIMLKLIHKHHNSKHNIFNHASKIVTLLHPNLTQEEKDLSDKKLKAAFPLNDEEWIQLVNPFDTIISNLSISEEKLQQPDHLIDIPSLEHNLLNQIESDTQKENGFLANFLKSHAAIINLNFTYALFKCLSDTASDNNKQHKNILKNAQSFYQLNSTQMRALSSVIQYYAQLKNANERQLVIKLFQFGGEIQQALRVRDQHLQKVQNWINDLFDTPQLPQCEYKNNIISTKDNAHNKWATFSERELKHKTFTIDEVNQLFSDLSQQLKKSPDLLSNLTLLKTRYIMLINSIDNDDALNEFFITGESIRNRLSSTASHENSHTLLRNFIDVSMNAIINTRLDQKDILSKDPSHLENPLQKSEVIQFWLNQVRENNYDLRSLLEQQVQQSSSLDHALWRSKCILQVIENGNQHERIRKTGIQSLLRFWCQHKENITKSGDAYIDTETNQYCKIRSINTLFSGSTTMKYAIERVKVKIPYILRK